MATIIELLSTNSELLWAGVVSALVSTAVSYWFKRRETRHAAEVEYEFEQRKKLRELIGRYHGRLLNAANTMNYRFWNIYANKDEGWFDVNGDFSEPGHYYFRSTVYRFLNVCALVRQLESEAVMLDARIVPRKDFTFLNYAASLRWVMTDAALVKDIPYDNFHQTDHFFSDNFRQYCDLCFCDGNFISLDEFSKLLSKKNGLNPVLSFFDGLTHDEERLRWDRLAAFHLLLLAFINSFGYKRQYSSKQHFVDAAMQIKNPLILENLVSWIPRHDLGGDRETKKIIQALKEVRSTLDLKE